MGLNFYSFLPVKSGRNYILMEKSRIGSYILTIDLGSCVDTFHV